jgi:hypothetical protein
MTLQDFKDISIGLTASRCIKLGQLPSGIIKNDNIIELLDNKLLTIYNNLSEVDKKEALDYYKSIGNIVAKLFNCNTLENNNNERVKFNLEKIRENKTAWNIIMKN